MARIYSTTQLAKVKASSLLFLFTTAVALCACENPVKRAIRETEYSAYELVGIQKRDLLKRRINETQTEEKQAGEEFTDALDKLRKLYGLQGGTLEKNYESLKSAYETCDDKAKDIRSSIDKMETVANDLFREWKGEIEQMQTPDLKAKSRDKLNETQNRFEELDRHVKQAEKKMEPILVRLHDHVLYLKHNLNAESVASLKKEQGRIEGDINGLIADMNKSITQADEFIKSLP